jgi:hypothetical protein
MGSFGCNNNMCHSQYYNGRPLSVALTEPFDTELVPYIESDFALNNHHNHHDHHHHRSRSSGRSCRHESYSTLFNHLF